MSSMTSSAIPLMAQLTPEQAKSIKAVLGQPHITGQDVRSALGNAPACDCVRGQYLCPVARALWGEVTAAWDYYQANRLNPEAWQKYQKARQAYDNHLS